jgi:hypothetical protein
MTSWSQGNNFTAAPGLPFKRMLLYETLKCSYCNWQGDLVFTVALMPLVRMPLVLVIFLSSEGHLV